MKKPRLIISDIDGVIAVHGHLEPSVGAALRQAQRIGVLATVATGRGFFRVQRCVGSSFIPNCPMILENGGRICTPEGQTTDARRISARTYRLVRDYMSPTYVEAVDFFQADDHRYVVLRHPQFGDETEPFLAERYVEARYTAVSDFISHAQRVGCCKLTFFTHPEVAVAFPPSVNWSRNERYHTVMAHHVSKGTAVQRLCRQLDISYSEVLVAGNDYNDLELLRLPVQWRVAVGEDCPELKGLATHHVESPKEYGELLRQLC